MQQEIHLKFIYAGAYITHTIKPAIFGKVKILRPDSS